MDLMEEEENKELMGEEKRERCNFQAVVGIVLYKID